MYTNVLDVLSGINGGTKIANIGVAFPISHVQQVYDVVAKQQWIILGGDIINSNYEYTHDNWYYQPHRSCTLSENVQEGINKSEIYLSKYVEINGSNFFVAFTISNSYVDSK